MPLLTLLSMFQRGGHACREVWPEVLVRHKVELIYSIVLAVVLMLIPLVLMATFYGLVAKELWISSRKASIKGI